MQYLSKTKQGFIEEISSLKKRIRELELSEANCKRVNDALRNSELKYRQLIENTRDLIYITDREGFLTYINPTLDNTLGYTHQEWKGQPFTKIIAPEYIDSAKYTFKRAMKGDSIPVYDIEMIREDGTRLSVEVNVATLYNTDGNPAGRYGICRDVTERKKAEEALRESQQQLTNIIEFLPDATLAIDKEKRVIIWNKAIEKMTGVPAAEMIGKSDYAYTVPFYGEARAQLMDLVFENNEEIALKYPEITREGDSLLIEVFCNALYNYKGAWVLAKSSPLHDQAGNLIGAIEIIRDISDRKRAEEALHQSEAILRSVFKATPVGLCVMKNRVLQSVNKAFCDNLGYSESDMIGRTTRMLYENENEYERVGHILNTRLSEVQLTYIATKLRRRDSSVRDVALTATPLYSKDISDGMTLITVEDITDRQRTEEELKENRKQLENIIEFLPDATLVIDKEGKVIAWNRAIESMTGVKKEDMIGKSKNEYVLPFYRDRKHILIDLALKPDMELEKKYTSIQRVGDILFGESYTPNLPPGNIHLSATASVLRDEHGDITAAIECIRDNTERKKLEERLNRAEKMESLGTLAGGVAHDLNNVLGVLVGYSELLDNNLPKDSPLKRYTDNILKSSIKGAAIIQDLLTLARRGVSSLEVVDLNHIIADYLQTPEFEKLQFYHPDVKFTTKLGDELLNIKGSPIHLGKTIMNLVSNAAEAIYSYGEITIRTENRYLHQPIKGYDEVREGDYVVLTVSDTGSGIPAGELDKIFEPFYTKKVMGRSGTGLGLAVVWGTVKDHNGYIDVQSQEGKGTTFTIYFPMTKENLGTVKKAVAPVLYMGRGEVILVVDDVREQRELAINMLSSLGYQVEAVGGGEEAVEYLKINKADLLVLDMIMDPGIDGYETYRRIKEINPGQKAVIVSGFSETDRAKSAQEIGAGAFVRKPYILEQIGLAVRKELDRK